MTGRRLLRPRRRALCAATLLATVAVYVPGIAWLAVLFGAEKSIAFGLTPFILGDILKIVLALVLVPAIRRVMR